MINKIVQQNRDRVKKHLEQKKSEGFRRLSCFISGLAFEWLQVLKQETGQSTGDLIESLLVAGISPCKEREPEKQISEDTHIDDMDKFSTNSTELIYQSIQVENVENQKTNSTSGEPGNTGMVEKVENGENCFRENSEKEKDADTMEPDQEKEPEKTATVAVEQSLGQHLQPLIDLSRYDLNNLTIANRDRITLQLHEAYPDRTHSQMRIDFLNENGILLNGNPWTKKQLTDQLCRARERQKAWQEK